MKDEAISIGVNNLDTESSYLTIVIVKEKV